MSSRERRSSYEASGRPGTRLGVLLVAAVSVSACTSGTDLGDELSDAEAAQLLSALSAVYLPSPSAPSATAAQRAPALVPTTTLVTDTTQFSVTCPAGGTATVVNGDSISITVDVRLNPSPDTTFASSSTYSGRSRAEVRYLGCGGRDGTGGVWTFDADPGLVLEFQLDGTTRAAGLTGGGSTSSTTSSWDGLWSGTLGWENGGRSGSCVFSVDMTSATTVVGGQSTWSYSQEGQICGITVSTSASSGS